MSSDDERTVGSLADALERRFPRAWSEEWDNVGLIVGERSTPVTGVLVTLDATAEAVARAAASGANVLVTHHPPYLGEPLISAGPGPAGTIEAALRSGVGVISLHTNLDRSPEGATALVEALGLEAVAPLEMSPEPVSFIVTYAPAGAVGALRDAMAQAGAGRIGNYEACAFTSDGFGHFSPMAEADPAVEDEGSGVAETRIEMIAPREAAARVLDAAFRAHPYEEPVVVAVDGVRARGVARMGRVCSWRNGATVGELSAHVTATLGSACRVWGDPGATAGRIAVGNGSVGSLVPAALSVADTLIGGEVRYHDALAAAAAGLAVIEAGHDVSEWPMVDVLRNAVRQWRDDLPVTAEAPHAGWWTTEVPDVSR